MKIEIGKRYRLVRNDGRSSNVVTVEQHDAFGGDCAHYESRFQVTDNDYRWSGDLDTGEIWNMGRLEALDEPQQAVVHTETQRPAVGVWDDEPGELARMRRVFATWDFRSCT